MASANSFKCHPSAKRISEQFLCCVPLSQFDFLDSIDILADETNGLANQDDLLKITVNHPLLHEYPLKLSYQQVFLKSIVKELENKGAEISSDLYSKYCSLLGMSAQSEDWRFRIYSLRGLSDPYQHIVLKESNSIISNGTTGLCSWQATQDLVNWCSEHSALFENRRVLELGSGSGLGGLSVIALCQPEMFYFSDCHPHVLQLLQDNVLLNAKRWTSHSSQKLKSPSANSALMKRNLISCAVKNTNVSVLKLPWEHISVEYLGNDIPFDIVIASDLVYDFSLFKPLSSALVYLIERGCGVIMACAERNPGTLEEFLKVVDSSNLEVVPEASPKTKVISFSNAAPARIFQIKKRYEKANTNFS